VAIDGDRIPGLDPEGVGEAALHYDPAAVQPRSVGHLRLVDRRRGHTPAHNLYRDYLTVRAKACVDYRKRPAMGDYARGADQPLEVRRIELLGAAERRRGKLRDHVGAGRRRARGCVGMISYSVEDQAQRQRVRGTGYRHQHEKRLRWAAVDVPDG
jgi:hypothetical protein